MELQFRELGHIVQGVDLAKRARSSILDSLKFEMPFKPPSGDVKCQLEI